MTITTIARAAGRTWLTLLAAVTAVAAIIATTGLQTVAREWTALEPGNTVTALQLIAHNLPLVLVPALLVAFGWHRGRWTQRIGSAAIVLWLSAQALALGVGIGAWPQVIPSLPHLPIELAALATGTAAWQAARGEAPARLIFLLIALTALLVLLAAPIEVAAANTTTYEVPQ